MIKPINDSESPEPRDSGSNHVALEEKCRQLTEECAWLREQLEEVQKERRDCVRALGALLFKDSPIPSKADMLASLGQQPTLHELIDELEAEMTAEESGHA